MGPGRGTLTDHILSVVQVIQMGKQSGLLTIGRDEQGTLEQGEITFVYGQVTQARCGPLSGQKALAWLSSWSPCRFLFVPTNLEGASGSRSSANHYVSPHITTQEHSSGGTLPQTGTFLSSTSVPRRIRQDHEALRLLDYHGLSRMHRHVYLLVDGRRTTAELIRLVARRPDEVLRLLQDLERINVIQR